MVLKSKKSTPLFAYGTLLTLGVFGSGCAGPTTPLGAVWTVRVPLQIRSLGAYARNLSGLSNGPSIEAIPSRQALHLAKPLTLMIHDPEGGAGHYRITVLYNSLDVTKTFLQQATLSKTDGGKNLTLYIPKLTLPAGTEHRIEFGYSSPSGAFAQVMLKPPSCEPFSKRSIASTEPFKPSRQLLDLITQVSNDSGFNPGFAAGLVAQESGFNPQSVSWARAIGLTQITPIAEEELAVRFQHWPRYPGLNDYSLPWLKGMILTGEVNGMNEWRLDEARSIRGGLAYAEYLFSRWSAQENEALIAAAFEDRESALPKLVIASYNSGYSRVRGVLSRDKASWLEAAELRGIRKYVDRILSFCDHFTAKEASLEGAS